MPRYINWTRKEDLDALIDLDGCIFKESCDPKPNTEFLFARIYDMLKPGAYCLGIVDAVHVTAWTILLENIGLDIKDQVAVIDAAKTYSIIMSMKTCEKNYAYNALVYGNSGINIRKLRIGNAIVGWNGLGDTGQSWTAKNCGFRNKQQARPVQGRFPCNLLINNKIAMTHKDSFHTLDEITDTTLFNFCLDMITPPGETSLVINPCAYNDLFINICQQRQQSCIVMTAGVLLS